MKPVFVCMLKAKSPVTFDNQYQSADVDRRWVLHQAKRPNPKRMLFYLETKFIPLFEI
jgi:hypothetical protein